jgi:hypothetical protein
MTKQSLDGESIFLVHDFLSPEECASFIARSEQAGYEAATVSTLDGLTLDPDLRDNAWLVMNDPALAAAWWRRAAPFLPQRIRTWEAVGLGERFRFYRYGPGQKFARHLDGYAEREDGAQSHYTFLVYLNDDFAGGETTFYGFDLEPRLSVRPRRGAALVFVHRQFHEGAAVTAGVKYVLRTDVFYAERAEPDAGVVGM